MLWCGVVGLGLVVFVAVVLWVGSFAEDAFSKVKPGMTLSEVDGLRDMRFVAGGGNLFFRWTNIYRSEPRLWRPTQTLTISLRAGSRIEHVTMYDPGPDTRTLLERAQDEYRYQKGKLGW
jgi:hypothetical protein